MLQNGLQAVIVAPERWNGLAASFPPHLILDGSPPQRLVAWIRETSVGRRIREHGVICTHIAALGCDVFYVPTSASSWTTSAGSSGGARSDPSSWPDPTPGPAVPVSGRRRPVRGVWWQATGLARRA